MLLINKKHSNKKLTTEEFIERARSVHGDKYSYDKVEYKNSKNKVTITCGVHGDFEQLANDHVNLRRGCRKCFDDSHSRSLILTNAEFIKRANKTHNNKYDYSKTEYTRSNKKVTIVCPIHNDFEQKANDHINGSGCRKCAFEKNRNNFVSRQETEWLDSLKIATLQRQYIIEDAGIFCIVDAYDNLTNTIYEYNGDYWHGNVKKYDRSVLNEHLGKTMGELYDATLKRERLLKERNYNLVVMWENDYRKNSLMSSR